MSADSFAAFRRHAGTELAALAEEHYKHDLEDTDRAKLVSASQKFSTYATIGSAVGLGLGILLAYRVRSFRSRAFAAFRATEKPTHVQFADGRLEAIPDVTDLVKPTTLGDFATYTFFAAGGLFVFGELGMLGGAWSAQRSVMGDPESAKRIENAFRRFRADVLRREAEELDKQSGKGAGMFGSVLR